MLVSRNTCPERSRRKEEGRGKKEEGRGKKGEEEARFA